MAAIVKAVDQHGDLLRMAIAAPGNDFRLGACEAPPAIISTYLGDDLTTFLEAYKSKNSVLLRALGSISLVCPLASRITMAPL